MKAVFLETTMFTATVDDYLADDEYRQLQNELLANPHASDVMLRSCEKTLAYCDRHQAPAADVALRKKQGHLAH